MSNQISSVAKVFVLAGPSNSGKTTALNYLAYEIASRFRVRSRTNPQPTNNPFDNKGNSIDGKFAFSVSSQGKTILVGIWTAGDDEDAVESGFKYFDATKCEICFLASRTWGKVFNRTKTEAETRAAIHERIRMTNSTSNQAKAIEEQKMVRSLLSRI